MLPSCLNLVARMERSGIRERLFLDLLRHEKQVTCKFVADQLSSGLVSSQARRVIEEGD